MEIQRITSEWLREQGLRLEDIRDFELKWPDGLELTEIDLLRGALEWGLMPDWLASRILSGPAQEAYEKAKARAEEAYEKAKARAEEPRAEEAHAEEAHQKAIARAWKAYQKATARTAEAGSKALLRAYEAYQRGTGPSITASTLKAAHAGEAAAHLAYLEAKRSADEAHERATHRVGSLRAAWEAYEKAKARALAAIIEGEWGSARPHDLGCE